MALTKVNSKDATKKDITDSNELSQTNSRPKDYMSSIRVTSTVSIPLKYLCLAILVVQTSTNVLLLRYTRTARKLDEPVYIASTAVLFAEVLKILICLVILLKEAKYNVDILQQKVIKEAIDNWKDSIKLLVPALLYVLQNNLLYLALSNLDAATYQVTYQLKILTTAIFSVLMLGRKLTWIKWLSLLILMIGVVLVQWPTGSPASAATVKDLSSRFIGLIAVLSACVSSGFSGVYFEKILKGSSISLWMRNLELAFFSILIALFGVVLNDSRTIIQGGFFQGYNALVVLVIVIQAIGGLIIGAVVKYADNILKGFATSISIVVSSIISYYLIGDFQPTWLFILGSTGVLLATYIYSLPSSVFSPSCVGESK